MIRALAPQPRPISANAERNNNPPILFMNSTKFTSIVAICGALGLLGGCASEPESHLVTAPPPAAPTGVQQVVVAAQPAQVVLAPSPQVVATTAVAGTSYIVMQAPPAPQPEAVPARPSSDHVWIAGYWTWQDSRYAWMAGHWEMPPSRGAVWINPRWQPEGGAIRFYEGYWN